MNCEHKNFQAQVDVTRLTDGGLNDNPDPDAKIIGYSAEVNIHCADCGIQFRFIGVPGGYSHANPMVSYDETTLRAPIEPIPDPLKEIKQ